MTDYYARCPHTRELKRERGDFVTEGNRSYFRVDEVFTEVVPCGGSDFEIYEKGVFFLGSGYDPEALLVKCKLCGGKYYLFPRLKLVKMKVQQK